MHHLEKMLLEKYIKDFIAQHGPITMASFIEIAMSHPQYGYYQTREPFGVAGDFTTAPEISQMFGELIGIWCADIWHQAGCPADTQIVEIGPGRGTLMDDLLRATKKIPGFHENISISMVETSKRLQEIQQQKIKHHHPKIKWLDNISQLPDKPLIIVSNELFDVLPVHQYVKKQGKWFEKILVLDEEGGLKFALNNINFPHEKTSTFPDFSENIEIPDGSIIETSPVSARLMQEISSKIKQRGLAALIIDYGYIQPEYNNTILALGKHRHHNLLQDIGNVDISSHVDFSMLSRTAKAENLNVYGAISQGEFLKNMGIETRCESLCQKAATEQKKSLEIAMERLISKTQMGDLFKVIAVCNENLVPAGFTKL